MNLFKNLIKTYINNMTINDVIMFSENENIHLENDEYFKIYEYLKENWEKLIDDEAEVKNYIVNNFNKEKQEKILNLFFKYQKKYRSYL